VVKRAPWHRFALTPGKGFGVAARRLNTAPSILLVAAGIGLALLPGLPRIELAPELVLLGILPPLIYSAGVAMSWREFRFNLRPITLQSAADDAARFRLRRLHQRCRGGHSARSGFLMPMRPESVPRFATIRR
jgi:hypothetical protein